MLSSHGGGVMHTVVVVVQCACGLADGFARFHFESGLEMIRSGVHSMRIFNHPITYEFKENIGGKRGMHRMNYRCA